MLFGFSSEYVASREKLERKKQDPPKKKTGKNMDQNVSNYLAVLLIFFTFMKLYTI